MPDMEHDTDYEKTEIFILFSVQQWYRNGYLCIINII